MKIKEIISRVNKSKEFESPVFIGEIANEFNIGSSNYEIQDRLKSYFIGNWYCTDSCVGYKVYFLDDEPVALSSQTGRKMGEDIEWISKELYLKVKNYILTFEDDKQEDSITLCNINQEIGDTYKIHYHSQLFEYHKKIAIHKGTPVLIIDFHRGQEYNKARQYEPSLVKIQYPSPDEEVWIELGELDFPFNTSNTLK